MDIGQDGGMKQQDAQDEMGYDYNIDE